MQLARRWKKKNPRKTEKPQAVGIRSRITSHGRVTTVVKNETVASDRNRLGRAVRFWGSIDVMINPIGAGNWIVRIDVTIIIIIVTKPALFVWDVPFPGNVRLFGEHLGRFIRNWTECRISDIRCSSNNRNSNYLPRATSSSQPPSAHANTRRVHFFFFSFPNNTSKPIENNAFKYKYIVFGEVKTRCVIFFFFSVFARSFRVCTTPPLVVCGGGPCASHDFRQWPLVSL